MRVALHPVPIPELDVAMTYPHDRSSEIAHQVDALRPALREVEQELEHHLADVCATKRVHDESTGELMRLEEALSEAAQAAKQAVSIRRRLRMQREAERQAERRARETTPNAERAGVREFVDSAGTVWHVWEVRPGKSRGSRGWAGLNMGAYEGGWLAFETWDGHARKRLPNFPAGWNELANDALQELLARADDVRTRRRRSSGGMGGLSDAPDGPES